MPYLGIFRWKLKKAVNVLETSTIKFLKMQKIYATSNLRPKYLILVLLGCNFKNYCNI